MFDFSVGGPLTLVHTSPFFPGIPHFPSLLHQCWQELQVVEGMDAFRQIHLSVRQLGWIATIYQNTVQQCCSTTPSADSRHDFGWQLYRVTLGHRIKIDEKRSKAQKKNYCSPLLSWWQLLSKTWGKTSNRDTNNHMSSESNFFLISSSFCNVFYLTSC